MWHCSRIDSFEPLKAATTAEETKRMKYTEILNRGYLFQPVAFEIQGGAGPDNQRFLSKLSKLIQDSTNEARASAFLRQIISVCIQMSNAACVIGTLRPQASLDEIYDPLILCHLVSHFLRISYLAIANIRPFYLIDFLYGALFHYLGFMLQLLFCYLK